MPDITPSSDIMGNFGVPSLVPFHQTRQDESEDLAQPPKPLALTRVLHIINGEYFSGAERVQQGLGYKLDTFGFQADFVCLKAGKFLDCCDLPPNRIMVFPMTSRQDFSVVPRITAVAKSENYHLLHAHTPRSAMIAAMVARRTGLPWIYHVHSPTARDSTRRWINYLNDWIERVALFSCQSLITVSNSLRGEMLKKGWDRKRVTTVHNGVEPLPAIDWDNRPSHQPWQLGMVALMRPRKGVEVLLEALYILSSHRRDIHLNLIGSFETTSYQNQIERLIKKWHLESLVTLSGFTKDVPSKLKSLDALILPSLFGEGLPMVVLEAMAAGLPVVATAVEGTPEALRHGVDGLIALPRNPGDLAMKIEQLCCDRIAWAAMGRNARARQQRHFTTEIMSKRVAKVYRRVLDHAIQKKP